MYGFCEALAVRKNVNALNKQLKRLHTEEAKRKKSAYQRLANRLNRSEYGKMLENKLKAANMKIGPFEWTLIRAGAVIIVTVLLYRLIALGFPYNVTAAYFLVNWGGKQFLKTRANKYAKLINHQLPEVCRMMASCIRAGLSIQQSIEMVAKELKPPAGPLFQAMRSEIKVGTTLDAVLERLIERFSGKEIRLMTQTILVQRQAGGNLSQALDHLARTLEERERMNQELSNQTAESRYIAFTLALMPIFLIIAFNMVFKGFITPVFTLPGLILLAVVLALMAVGFILIRKVSNIKA
jgi:tight adherence protein B